MLRATHCTVVSYTGGNQSTGKCELGVEMGREKRSFQLRAAFLGVAIGGLLTGLLLAVPVSATTLSPITVGVQAPVPVFAPAYLMQENPGICAAYHIKPTYATVNPISGPPALVGGSVPIQFETNGSFFEQAASSSTSVVLLAGYGPNGVEFWGGKNIHSIAGFKGKTIAAITKGSGTDLLARAVLRAAGLKPDVNVHFVYSGSLGAEIAEGQDGNAAGFIAPPPLPAAATASGLHAIVNLTTDPTAVPLNTLAVVAQGSFFRAHKALVTAFLQCLSHADAIARSNRGATISALESVIGEPPSLAGEAYTFGKSIWNLYPFTIPLARKALADVRAGGLSSQVAGFSYSSIDVNALKNVKGTQPTPYK